ncbi:tryptophan synthase beta subunit-like PLP-dependent enzyme [Calocera cornea HHB12733]|uniref:L-serine ammonia-lyase n=1 Tax=Calocera cornea HHB12733 TaxID=1353952 RepID=A0A165CKE2_9BASI|nr:tryptophan synthase beta subunit-like PLP-dependent enzyme [Calocera cornea HHB12733]
MGIRQRIANSRPPSRAPSVPSTPAHTHTHTHTPGHAHTPLHADVDLEKPLYIKTPLVYSPGISERLGCAAFLKLENLQPPLSFKYRGISLFAQRALELHGPSVHLIAASSGNAGLALAYTARRLDVRCTIFIPAPAVKIRAALEKEGAEVVVGGAEYVDALNAARKVFDREKHAVMVPSYDIDDPLIWEGHSSMIHEIKRQLPAGERPAAIFCAVGGGGLLGGVLQGCTEMGWNDVMIVGCETVGSNCFHRTMVANASFASEKGKATMIPASLAQGVSLRSEAGVKLASLDKLTSRAASLGATSPSSRVVATALKRGRMRCVSVPDQLSMEACGIFAEEHKMLIELACSTTLVPAYNPDLYHTILPRQPTLDDDQDILRPVVFIVCGGAKISVKEVEDYERIAEKEADQCRWAFVDRIKPGEKVHQNHGGRTTGQMDGGGRQHSIRQIRINSKDSSYNGHATAALGVGTLDVRTCDKTDQGAYNVKGSVDRTSIAANVFQGDSGNASVHDGPPGSLTFGSVKPRAVKMSMFSRTEKFVMPETLPYRMETVLNIVKDPVKMMSLNPTCISVTQSTEDPSIYILETQSSWFGGLLHTPSRFPAESKQYDDGAEYTVDAALGVKTVGIWSCKALDGPPEGTSPVDEAEGWCELSQTGIVTAPFPLISLVTSFYKESHQTQIKGLLDRLRAEAAKTRAE